MAKEKAYIDPQGRRNAARVNFKSLVDIVTGDHLYKEMSGNISDTGIFLKSKFPNKYSIFDKLTLSFQMPDSRPIKHIGTVIRKTDNGIGVVFSGIDYPTAYRSPPTY